MRRTSPVVRLPLVVVPALPASVACDGSAVADPLFALCQLRLCRTEAGPQ